MSSHQQEGVEHFHKSASLATILNLPIGNMRAASNDDSNQAEHAGYRPQDPKLASRVPLTQISENTLENNISQLTSQHSPDKRRRLASQYNLRDTSSPRTFRQEDRLKTTENITDSDDQLTDIDQDEEY